MSEIPLGDMAADLPLPRFGGAPDLAATAVSKLGAAAAGAAAEQAEAAEDAMSRTIKFTGETVMEDEVSPVSEPGSAEETDSEDEIPEDDDKAEGADATDEANQDETDGDEAEVADDDVEEPVKRGSDTADEAEEDVEPSADQGGDDQEPPDDNGQTNPDAGDDDPEEGEDKGADAPEEVDGATQPDSPEAAEDETPGPESDEVDPDNPDELDDPDGLPEDDMPDDADEVDPDELDPDEDAEDPDSPEDTADKPAENEEPDELDDPEDPEQPELPDDDRPEYEDGEDDSLWKEFEDPDGFDAQQYIDGGHKPDGEPGEGDPSPDAKPDGETEKERVVEFGTEPVPKVERTSHGLPRMYKGGEVSELKGNQEDLKGAWERLAGRDYAPPVEQLNSPLPGRYVERIRVAEDDSMVVEYIRVRTTLGGDDNYYVSTNKPHQGFDLPDGKARVNYNEPVSQDEGKVGLMRFFRNLQENHEARVRMNVRTAQELNDAVRRMQERHVQLTGKPSKIHDTSRDIKKFGPADREKARDAKPWGERVRQVQRDVRERERAQEERRPGKPARAARTIRNQYNHHKEFRQADAKVKKLQEELSQLRNKNPVLYYLFPNRHVQSLQADLRVARQQRFEHSLTGQATHALGNKVLSVLGV